MTAVSSRIRTRFRSLAQHDTRIVIGVGTPVRGLELVGESYREACLAARAALLVPLLGDVTRWGTLGPYEVLV